MTQTPLVHPHSGWQDEEIRLLFEAVQEASQSGRALRDVFSEVAEALRRGWDVDEIVGMTAIDPWFVVKIQGIVKLEEELRREGEKAREKSGAERRLPVELLRLCKRKGFSDRDIAEISQFTEGEIREQRKSAGLTPAYKMVDTCAAEFEAQTPYFYSSYEPVGFDEAAEFAEREQA